MLHVQEVISPCWHMDVGVVIPPREPRLGHKHENNTNLVTESASRFTFALEHAEEPGSRGAAGGGASGQLSLRAIRPSSASSVKNVKLSVSRKHSHPLFAPWDTC